MKRNLKLMSLLLALAMILGLLGACGSSSTSTEETTETSAEATTEDTSTATEEAEESEAAQTETATEAATAEAEESASTEATETAEVADATSSGEEIELPLTTDDVEISIWIAVNPNAYNYMDEGMASNETYNELQARTGISFDWIACTPDNQTESFTLSITSGDYYDVYIDGNSSYTAGADAAVEEDVFIDIADMIEEWCPNLVELLNASPESKAAALTDSGILIGAPQFFNQSRGRTNGFLARADWLEEYGGDLETYDDWYNFLTYIRDEYGSSYLLNANGATTAITAGYGVSGDVDTSRGVSMPFYQVDWEVKFSAIEDDFLDYLTMMSQWYEEGLIYTDFMSQTNQFEPDLGLITGGGIGIYSTDQWNIDVYDDAMEDGGSWVPIEDPGINADDTLHFGDELLMVNPIYWCISTGCDCPELVLQMFNYMYSDEGSLLLNYGVEGLTYTIGDDGEPHYTEMITEAEMSMDFAIYCHISTNAPYVLNVERAFESYSDKAIDALDVWAEDADSDYVLPSNITMTADESSSYNALATDIATYIAENLLKFIIGDKLLSEFDDFRATIQSMGIDTCIEIYQTAYERYLER